MAGSVLQNQCNPRAQRHFNSFPLNFLKSSLSNVTAVGFVPYLIGSDLLSFSLSISRLSLSVSICSLRCSMSAFCCSNFSIFSSRAVAPFTFPRLRLLL